MNVYIYIYIHVFPIVYMHWTQDRLEIFIQPRPSQLSFNTAISSCSRCGEWPAALAIFQGAQHLIAADVLALNGILSVSWWSFGHHISGNVSELCDAVGMHFLLRLLRSMACGPWGWIYWSRSEGRVWCPTCSPTTLSSVHVGEVAWQDDPKHVYFLFLLWLLT